MFVFRKGGFLGQLGRLADPQRVVYQRDVNYRPTTPTTNTVDIDPNARYGFTRAGIEFLFGNEYFKAIRARRDAVLAMLAATGKLTPCVSSNKWCEQEAKNGYVRVLNPVGIIDVLGVGWAPTEMGSDGSLAKAYAPDTEQKLQADFHIYLASQNRLYQIAGSKLGNLSPSTSKYGPVIANQWILGPEIKYDTLTLVDDKSGSSLGPTVINSKRLKGWSVKKFLDEFTDFWPVSKATDGSGYFFDIPGYGFRPNPPTREEYLGENGLAAFYARGGFLIHRGVVTGQAPAMVEQLTWNTGYCLCPNGTPRATWETAPGQDVEGYGWNVYVNATGPQYQILVKPRSAPWWADVGQALKDAFNALMASICQSAPILNAINQAMASKLCVNAASQACADGSPGCVCTTASNPQQAKVQAATTAINLTCQLTGYAPKDAPLPQGPQPDPPSTIPWPLVVGGGVLAALGWAFLGKPRNKRP